MPLGHIVAVSLDGKPLATSQKILLQVMSEEQSTGWSTEPVSDGVKQITSTGGNPWRVKELDGVVKFKRSDAGKLKVTALDFNGYPQKEMGSAGELKLVANVVYYLIGP
jgi:hypothetical protein